MARKSSKARKATRLRRYRKHLDALVTRHVAASVLAGETPVSVAVAVLREPERSKAVELAECLQSM